MSNRNRTIVLLIQILVLAGCGIYSFRGSIPDHLSDIEIRTFENRTTEFAVESDVEEALTERMLNERLLPLATTNEPDSYLEGTIERITDKPSNWDENENVLEFRLEFAGQVVWYDQQRGQELYSKRYTVFGTYFSDTKNAGLADSDQRTRETAYDQGIEELIDFIIESMTEEW